MQDFEVTPNGLRDSKDKDKTYVVIELNGTTKQLFDKAVSYINEKMENPNSRRTGTRSMNQ